MSFCDGGLVPFSASSFLADVMFSPNGSRVRGLLFRGLLALCCLAFLRVGTFRHCWNWGSLLKEIKGADLFLLRMSLRATDVLRRII